MPDGLMFLAECSLALAVACAVWIAWDILRGYRQHMAIMNLVWPITALYAGPFAVWGYLRVGRLHSERGRREAEARGRGDDKGGPLRHAALAATHCGSGCTLADLLVESALIALPLSLFGSEVAAAWALDYVFAFAIGIAFQYFSIRPMSDKPPLAVLKAAFKADALSLTSWQTGMYGWMAIALFVLFPAGLPKTGAVFWFMMQIAMLAGFATAMPVNAWLIRRGIKEPM
ncbi:DUF4396 domain-containing protein [Oleiagrimonas soli]|uniref:Membrane protein n=1 Tax=Oleiagrimonas soli TaxID=1543381 RepID=A0A099CXT5_9GAMM|nr:DUF4396 domain-containing protein [Oleiagrimonas soli]KGI77860.1 membrane protein [Oleiagrimonas soli]MBB6183795.1 hypothetical protein [Oleiagrimonas soli]